MALKCNVNNPNNFNFSSLHLLNLTDGIEAKAQKIKLRGRLRPMDIKVFEPMRQYNNGSTPPCMINNGLCSHLCLAAPHGHSCACPRGIPLISKYECAPGYSQLLVIALRFGIRTISLDTPYFTDVDIPLHGGPKGNIVAIDYDPIEDFIYWTEHDNKDDRSMKPRISRIKSDGKLNLD